MTNNGVVTDWKIEAFGENNLYQCLLFKRGYNGRCKYEECPESKYTKVLNMYNIFNLQKRHCE